jgi:hypothetical protein
MKLYLVLMAGPGSLFNLQALIDPVRAAFDGVVCTLHDSQDSEEARYLESVKGCGEVIHTKFVRRHDFSRNHYLYCGPIQNGDWCCQIDDKERLGLQFAANLRSFVQDVRAQGISGVWYYGKPFLFEYHESLRYVGNPHEGLVRDDGRMRAIELSTQYPNEPDIRYSVRGEQRTDPYHWVGHYAKYMLYPQSNHGLLCLADRGDPNILYPIRERNRQAFLSEMRSRGHSTTIDGLDALFAGPLDDKLRSLINADKVWQDYYRYYVLGDLEVKDEHLWTSLKSV